MNRGSRRSAASFVLGTLLFVASPVLGQGGRTLADWQRDLRDPAVDVCARAVQALVVFDRHAVRALTGALGDKEFRVRASAAVVLGDPNLRVRELAGEALNRIASAGRNQPATLPLNCH